MIRVTLPTHLRNLAGVEGEITVEVDGEVTQHTVLSAVEDAHPVLRGTIRDHGTLKRRAFVRFFVGEEDRSHDDPDEPLPAGVASGEVVFRIIGAMAGG